MAARDLPPLPALLAYGAGTLALVSAAASVVSPLSGVLLGGLALMLLAFAPFLLTEGVPAREHPDARFARRFRLAMLSLASFVLLLVLLFIEALAVLAAGGAFVSYSGFAEAFVRYFTIVAALFTVAIAAMVVVKSRNPSEERTTRFRSTLSAIGFSLVVGSLGGSLMAIGVFEVPAPKASFLLAAGEIGLLLLVRSRGMLPSFQAMSDWLEHEERLKATEFPAKITWALSGLAGSFLGLAAILSVVTEPGPVPLLLLGCGFFTILGSTYSVGISRRPVFDLEDAKGYKEHKRQVLVALSVGMTVQLAVLGILACLSIVHKAGGPTTPIVSLYDEHFILVMALALLPLPVVNAVRTRIPTDVQYDYKLKAISWNLSVLVLLVVAFGLFLGSGIAEGSGFELDNAIVLLSVGALLLIQFVKTRALLPGVLSLLASEIAQSRKADRDTKEKIERRMMATYIGGTVLLLFLVFLSVGSSMRTPSGRPVLDLPAGPVRDLVFVAVIASAVMVLVLIVVRYFQSQNMDERVLAQKKQEIGKKRLSSQELTRLMVLGASISAAATLVVVGAAMQMGVLRPIPLVGGFGLKSVDFFVFAILIGLGPYSIYHNRESARIRSIDARFPDFLRDLAENKRAGMTLTQAIVTSSKGSYGALTSEIRKMAAQIEWGVSFNEALSRFAQRVKTPLVGRTASLVVQANEAGGNVVDVLTAAADDAREIELLKRERRTSMSIYVMIIYVSFFVFLAVIWILTAQFVPEVAKAVRGAQGVSFGGIRFQAFDTQAFVDVFFHAALVQGFGGGLVAGVMEGGRPVNGLKHSFLLVVISYVVFRFMLGG
ncbi:MAG TPA: type II secretion system F family protein [Candidatus Thermoplasmatota archaeon]|nr:type II secretion system F family protein [Candidatus Thermoplasmatota archaeon]